MRKKDSLAKRGGEIVLDVVPRNCPECESHPILYEYRQPIRTYIKGRFGAMVASEWVCWECGYYDSNSPGFLEYPELHKNMLRDNSEFRKGKITEALFNDSVRVYPPYVEVIKKDLLPDHIKKGKKEFVIEYGGQSIISQLDSGQKELE